MARLALEFDAPVRTPVAVSQTHSRRYGYATTRKRAARSILGLLGARPFQALSVLPGTWIRLMNSKRRLARAGVRHPDHLIDALFGRPTEENLRHIIGHLPPGVSELVVHLADPATTVDGSDVPRGIDGDEFPNRIEEQRLITAPWIPTLLSAHGVQRTRFRALRSRP